MPHVPAPFRSITPFARTEMRGSSSYAPNNGGFPKPQAVSSSLAGGTRLSKSLGRETGLRNLGAKVHREPSGRFVPAPFAAGGAA